MLTTQQIIDWLPSKWKNQLIRTDKRCVSIQFTISTVRSPQSTHAKPITIAQWQRRNKNPQYIVMNFHDLDIVCGSVSGVSTSHAKIGKCNQLMISSIYLSRPEVLNWKVTRSTMILLTSTQTTKYPGPFGDGKCRIHPLRNREK